MGKLKKIWKPLKIFLKNFNFLWKILKKNRKKSEKLKKAEKKWKKGVKNQKKWENKKTLLEKFLKFL